MGRRLDHYSMGSPNWRLRDTTGVAGSSDMTCSGTTSAGVPSGAGAGSSRFLRGERRVRDCGGLAGWTQFLGGDPRWVACAARAVCLAGVWLRASGALATGLGAVDHVDDYT